MSSPGYEHFCRLAAERSGLVLGPTKAYLVSSRLEPLARANGLPSVEALLERLRAGASETLVQACVDAMATHESLFFRDVTPFELLASTVFPELARNRPGDAPIRIWCAACSSGQEPYSVAMLAKEQTQVLGGRRIEIVATDMAEQILVKAREGLFNDFETQRGLSPERRARWMRPKGGGWEVDPVLKAMVRFSRHNLLDGVRGLGVFDIIFCRNVLIYFDQARKSQVLEQLSQAIATDGALFLGSAETIIGLTDRFALEPGARGLYRPGQALARSA